MKYLEFDNPAVKIKVLDYTYTSEPSINTALPLKISKIKTILFYIGVVLSFGFIWLLAKWSAKKRAMFCTTICTLQKSTCFLIHDEDTEGGMTLVQKLNKYEVKMKRYCPSFVYHDRTYVFIQQKQVFIPIRYEQLGFHLDQLKKDKFHPYNEQKRRQLLGYYGDNVMNLYVQSRMDIFLEQMLTPYEVFQTYGIILWIIEQYYIFAFILLAYSVYTYWENANEIVLNQEKLAFQSYFDVQTKVLISDLTPAQVVQSKEDVQLYEHKSIIKKEHFNSLQQVEQEAQAPSKKPTKRKSKEVKNEQNLVINNRNIKFKSISSHKLVPGDIIILNQADIVPCDCVLLRGEALVNEKYSTGQNYLVRKEEIQNFTYQRQNEKSFLLYLGSQVVKIKNIQYKLKKSIEHQSQSAQFSMNGQKIDTSNQIVCLVTQTNFNTLRGKFLRAIRYQNKQEQKFFKETIYFIYIILVITTLVFFIYIGILGQYTSRWKMFRIYIDILVTAVPPTLPTILNVGIKFVQNRLKANGINCILPKSALTGGKVDTIILKGEEVFGRQYSIHSAVIGTKENRAFGITFSSLQQFRDYQQNQQISHSNLQELIRKKKEKSQFHKIGYHFINALASSHTLQFFRRSVQGSVFQKKIFQFSQGANVKQDTFQTQRYKIFVQKIIRFKTKQMKMAVLVALQQKKQKFQSPEHEQKANRIKLKHLAEIDQLDSMEQQGSSIREPSIDNDRQAEQLQTSQKNKWKKDHLRRVVYMKGSAEKVLYNCNKETFPQNAFDYIVDMAQKGFILHCYAMKQFNVEPQQNYNFQQFVNRGEFTFLGFIIIQQVRSQQNKQAIKALNDSEVKVIFLSQERELQTTSRAVFNGICHKNQLLLCNISKNRDKIYCKGHIQWQSGSPQFIHQFIREFQEFGPYSKVSMSSSLYEEMFIKREIGSADIIFQKSIIYNKMQLKHERNLYNQLQKRKKVTFAVGGSGTVSQCANLSLELQRSDSALLSNFYTNSSSLKSIVTCLKICRAGLSTNYHEFNMIILFSLIQFTTVAILNFNYQTLAGDQMLYEDLFITFPIFITINLTEPSNKLSKEIPSNSFFSCRQMVSMIGQLTIQLLAQLGFMGYVLSIQYFQSLQLKSQHYYFTNENFQVGSELSLALFVLSNNLYLGIVLSTSVSKPFRKPFYTNPYYTLNLIILWLYNTFIVIFPSLTPENMRSKSISKQSEFILVLALVVGNLVMVIMYLFQNLIAFLWSARNPWLKTRQFIDQVY